MAEIIFKEHHLSNFSSDVQNLHATKIQVLDQVPDALTFLREYVALSKPVIIRNAFPRITLDQIVQHHHHHQQQQQQQYHQEEQSRQCHQQEQEQVPANNEQKENKEQEWMIHVDVTPDGHGDCIRTVDDGKRMFVMPLVKKMSLSEFVQGLRRQSQSQSCYHHQHYHHSKEKEKIIQKQEAATKSSSVLQKKNRNNDHHHHHHHHMNRQMSFDDNGLRVLKTTTSAEKINPAPACNKNNHNAKENKQDVATQVLYYSRQNDCLRNEFRHVMHLFPSTIPFAQEAFHMEPEAVNIWIGNERSVSSMHKDHYENIMCVACGEKVFTICPPSDAMFLKERFFPTGSFQQYNCDCDCDCSSDHCDCNCDHHCDAVDSPWTVQQHWTTAQENPECHQPQPVMTRWMESNVEKLVSSSNVVDQSELQEYLQQNPLLKYAHPIKVHVKAGDMFYLPSLWYHRVTQTCETVAVNYWYDMRFDSPQWCMFHLLEEVGVCDM